MADVAGRAFAKSAHFLGHTGDNLMDQGKWFVLAKGDEMDLVVHKGFLADGVQHCRAVIRNESRARDSLAAFQDGFPINNPNKTGMLEFHSEVRDVWPEMRILEGKRRRRFGPDQEIRLPRAAGGPQTELLEFRHVGLVLG